MRNVETKKGHADCVDGAFELRNRQALLLHNTPSSTTLASTEKICSHGAADGQLALRQAHDRLTRVPDTVSCSVKTERGRESTCSEYVGRCRFAVDGEQH